MAIAKVILNGVTQMDVTQKTVTAGSMLSGATALKNDGTDITGSITSQAAQTIHPSTIDQTIASGKYLTGTQTIKAVTTTNLTAANIVSGVTVKVGDSTDDDCVASVTGTAETGGGGGPTLLSSQTVELSCTNTSWTLLETLNVGTNVFFDGVVYVKIRDTAGRRAGYFYGSDSYIYNMHYINGSATITTAGVSNNIGWYCGTSTTNLTASRNGTYQTEQAYYGLRAITANADGELTIYGRYNATYSRTIDSTYKVDVYLLPYPSGTFE